MDSSLTRADIETRNFITHVYQWMSAGLALTGMIAVYMAANPGMILALARNQLLFMGLLGGELVLVIALAGWVKKMSATTAAGAFLFYAALNGVTISTIFLIYTASSIGATFFVAAGMFGAMSVYGAVTKTDLTSMGNFCFMGLIGIILAGLVNIFLRSPAVSWATSILGVLIFTGLTAYDTQKLKAMNVLGNEGTDEDKKEAISGALTLYLDFINLFLSLLRLMGRRRD